MAPSKPAETASSPPTEPPDRIAVLDRSLADQIAAGEVVERPASVVKELVENALDAGADRIEVQLEQAGSQLIRVVDNGRGIVRDDLGLALTRHATSKIRTGAQLLDIATLGFRGEALASISAVARVRLRSRTSATDVGYELDAIPGESSEVVPTGMPLGTQVEVHRLFASVPARRKFLRAEATEVGHCSEAVLRAALVDPQVTFVLRHGPRTLIQLPAAGLDARVEQVLARRGGVRPLAISGEAGGVVVRGWFGRPDSPARGRQGVSIIVRKRVVSERALAQIVTRAYASALGEGDYPIACVMVEPPPGTVDVNVHPQKSEVRFAEPQRVYAAVREVLARELASAPWRRSVAPDEPSASGGEVARASAGTGDAAAEALGRWSDGAPVGGQSSSLSERADASPQQSRGRRGPIESSPMVKRDADGRPSGLHAADESGRAYRLSTRALSGGYGDHMRETAARVASLRSMAAVAEAAGKPEGAPGSAELPVDVDAPASRPAAEAQADAGPRLLATLAGGVALFEDGGDLLAVDLRAVRTHLVFRRLQASLAGDDAAAQNLLAPVVIKRCPEDVEACISAKAALARLGLHLDGFGDDAIIVRAVPAPLRHCVASEDIGNLLDRVLPWARMHRTTADADVLQAIAGAAGPDPAPRLAKTWLRELTGEGAALDEVPGIVRWSVAQLLRQK